MARAPEIVKFWVDNADFKKTIEEGQEIKVGFSQGKGHMRARTTTYVVAHARQDSLEMRRKFTETSCQTLV